MDHLQFYSRCMFSQITSTNVYYYFWQAKTAFSPHEHHQHMQTHKKYIQTNHALQMLLIISYSVWYK